MSPGQAMPMHSHLEKQPNSKHCFVCGLENASGLQLSFYQDEQGQVIAETVVPERFQGYPGVVHGGILASILDEVAMRAAMADDNNRFMVTARMTLRYRKQVPVGQPLKMVGRVLRASRVGSTARGEIRLPDGSVGAEVEALMVEYPAQIADSATLDELGWKVYPDEPA